MIKSIVRSVRAKVSLLLDPVGYAWPQNILIVNDCVIGSGTLVTRDIPRGHVAVGCPSRPIKTLDQYWDGIAHKVLPTHEMSPTRKREYLLSLPSLCPSQSLVNEVKTAND